MAKNGMNAKEKAAGYAIRDLPYDESQPFATYHNPKTGQIFKRLPADAWSMKQYLGRGFRMGLPAANNATIEVEENIDSNDIASLLKAMQKEIADLKSQLNGKNETVEEQQTPVQLSMF
jgi:hypothetical protein